FEIADQCLGVFAAVRIDRRNHDIDSLLFQQVRVFQHLIGLTDARRGADVNAQSWLLAIFHAGEQGFRRLSIPVWVHFLIGYFSSRARLSSSTFTLDSPRKPNCLPSVCALTNLRKSSSPMPRSRATRGT